MKRAILVPAALVPDALEELKSWLSISTAYEDNLLTGLLQASLDTCEGFIRQMPLEAQCEEIIRASSAWHLLDTCPVLAVTDVHEIGEAGARVALGSAAFELDFDDNGGARIRLRQRTTGNRVAVRFTAGLASGWASCPDAIRHGVVRLAAHMYRQRDTGTPSPVPPAAIAALWSPWRRMRIA